MFCFSFQTHHFYAVTYIDTSRSSVPLLTAHAVYPMNLSKKKRRDLVRRSHKATRGGLDAPLRYPTVVVQAESPASMAASDIDGPDVRPKECRRA